VFSTFLYTGNQTAGHTITNGIDLSGEGGLVWIKSRTNETQHELVDTVRGAGYLLKSDGTGGQGSSTSSELDQFNSDGFRLAYRSAGGNANNMDYASWSFRKAKGFFTCLTYSGSGSNRTISHDLGTVPGMILIKATDASENWAVYHVGNVAKDGNTFTGESQYLKLNSNDSTSTFSTLFNNTAPTSSVFSVGTHDSVNTNGKNYVAYIFGNNDQSFGEGGDQAIIKCGNWTGDNSYSKDISLGFEPQWLLVKQASGGSTWTITDSMRGIPNETAGKITQLAPSLALTESQFASQKGEMEINLHADGFTLKDNASVWNANNENYIYVAIRRPDGYVGKPPELGTDVFGIGTRSGSSSNALSNVNVFTDFSIIKRYSTSGEYWATNARLNGKYTLQTNSSDAQITGALPTSGGIWDYMAGHLVAASNGATNSGSDIIDYGWKRHAGFDVQIYSGNSTAGHQISHSLSKTPEMIWVKCRDATKSWQVYHKGLNGGTNPQNYTLELDETNAEAADPTRWNNTAPTSTNFTLGTSSSVNSSTSNRTYIAMLFASTDVSKVGFWVGDNTNNRQITTGFQPRFLIVFLSNQGGGYDWQMFDSTRGFISPNSNILKLNSTAAQSNQSTYFTPTSTGFTITESSFNGSGQNWIYYAHA